MGESLSTLDTPIVPGRILLLELDGQERVVEVTEWSLGVRRLGGGAMEIWGTQKGTLGGLEVGHWVTRV
jgi:hypothetical protein